MIKPEETLILSNGGVDVSVRANCVGSRRTHRQPAMVITLQELLQLSFRLRRERRTIRLVCKLVQRYVTNDGALGWP